MGNSQELQQLDLDLPPVTIDRTVVFLNGPPNCGKDTLARRITDELDDFLTFSVKDPMFDIADQFAVAFGASPGEFTLRHLDRELKEQPWGIINGRSTREFLIWLSEEVMKPEFGNGVFGQLACQAVENQIYDAIFSDGGFEAEVLEACERFDRVVIIRLHREDCDWGNDSRSYLYDVPGAEEHDVYLEINNIEFGVCDIINIIEGGQ